jgi:peptide/nickel transport system permease protein
MSTPPVQPPPVSERQPTAVPTPTDPVPQRRRRSNPLLWVGAAVVVLIVVTALVSFFWTPFPTDFVDSNYFHAPPGSGGHLLGTDMSGRDIVSWLMAGSRTALYVGIVAVGIAAVIGTPLGILAGMLRPRWSELLLRITDIWLALPGLLMALIFATVYGPSITSAMTAIGIASIPTFIRVVRSGTIRIMATDYVLAARASGMRGVAIAVRHVLPNVLGLIIVQCSVAYAIAILAEAALSFLGLGAGPTTASWGLMLKQGQAVIAVYPLLVVWPGVAIALAVLGFNMLGDGLRDRFDPRMEGR